MIDLLIINSIIQWQQLKPLDASTDIINTQWNHYSLLEPITQGEYHRVKSEVLYHSSSFAGHELKLLTVWTKNYRNDRLILL